MTTLPHFNVNTYYINTMKKILKKLKSIRRNLAVLFVTAWANYIYKTTMRKADERHRREGWMIYVVSEPFRTNRLITYNRAGFKRAKGLWGYHGRLLTLQTLKNECWYHTPDTAGNQAMDKRAIEIRRKAFIRNRLRAAKLI